MQRTSVESSAIAEVGYDATTNTLEILFKSGHVYQYFDVPQTTHDEFMAAPSIGQYYTSYIRNVFRFTQT